MANDPEQTTEDVSGIDPAARRPDAFLSYSRRDSEAAARLVELLEGAGKDVWIDRADIPAASRWRDELARAIEVSDAVIALVTPAWVASENCRQELEHAEAAGKRILPLLAEPVDAVPEGLAARQWIELPPGGDWSEPVARIVDAIDTDLPYVRSHARYLEEAQRWTASGRDRGFLLRGRELAAAEDWLGTRSERREPRPTPDQLAFIQAGRADATRRQRRLVAAVSAAAAVAIVLGVIALIQRNTAVDREQTARSRELAATAETRRATDPEAAVRLAAEGVEVKDTAQAQIALRRAIAASPLVARIGSAGDEVDAAGITPDGDAVIVARRDGLVRAVGVADGATRWSWQGDRGLQSVLVSARGDEVAVGQGEGARLLRTTDGAPLARYDVREDGDVSVGVVSPDGSRVAATSVDLATTPPTGSGGLWARNRARPIADIGAGDVPQRPEFSADGALLAVPYLSGLARIWDGRTGKLLHVLRGHRGRVDDVDVDPGGRWIATAGLDGTARLWSAADGAQVRLLPAGEGSGVEFASFSPDGRLLATGSAGGAAVVWAVPSGRRVATLEGHGGAVDQGEFLDRGTLVTGGRDGSARVWDVAGGRQAEVLLGHGLGARVAPFGRFAGVLTTGDEGTARVWRLAEAQEARIGDRGETEGVAVVDDGRTLVTVSSNAFRAAVWTLGADGAARRVAIRETASAADGSRGGAVIATAIGGLELVPPDGPARELAPGVWAAVRMDPSGTRVAARRFTGAVELLEVPSGRRIGSYPRATPLGVFQDMSFSRDGRRLALSELGGPVVVIDAVTGARVGEVPAPTSRALPAVAIDPAGRRVFRLDYGFPDARPVIVDVETGDAVTLSGEPITLDAAEFSGDGRELLTAGGGAAQVWDAATGGLLAELGAGRAETSTAAYGADDRLVVTGHADGIVRVWDRATSALLGEYDGGPGPVRQVAAGFGGTRILAVGSDATLRTFPCDACAPADQLRDVARRHVAFGRLDLP